MKQTRKEVTRPDASPLHTDSKAAWQWWDYADHLEQRLAEAKEQLSITPYPTTADCVEPHMEWWSSSWGWQSAQQLPRWEKPSKARVLVRVPPQHHEKLARQERFKTVRRRADPGLVRVLDLHEPVDGDPDCEQCQGDGDLYKESWPCNTFVEIEQWLSPIVRTNG